MPTTAKVSGLCPHCRERVELVAPGSGLAERCPACGGSFLAVLPELGLDAAAESNEVEVLLLPHGGGGSPWQESPRRSPGSHRTRGVWRLVLGVSVVGLVALVAICVLALLFPDGRRTWAQIAVPFGFLFALPLTVLLSHLSVSLVVRDPEGGASRTWRATMAVAFAVTVLAVGPFVWPHALGWVLGPSRVAALLAAVLVGVPPGILVARFGPLRPYRLALAVSLTFGLGFVLVLLPVGSRAMAGALLYTAVVAPLVFLGAWLGARLRPSLPAAHA